MMQKWYVVHTYSGFEEKAEKALKEKINEMGMDKYFSDIKVPKETVMEMVKGKRKTTERKIFPGYILVKMELNDETWHVVKSVSKITGFVGGTTNPPSLSEEEVSEITNQITEGAKRPRPKVLFVVGETVRIIDGPFTNFQGVVEEVKPEKGKLRVFVSIFGRPTPVELEFVQVEKA